MRTKKTKVCASAMAVLLAASLGTTALADESIIVPSTDGSQGATLIQQNGDGYSAITIYDGVTEVTLPQYTGETQTGLAGVGQKEKTTYYPFEITNVDEHGVWLVVKSYEVSADVDPQDLVETDLYRDGKLYEARDIMQKKTEGKTDTREATKTVTITSETKDKSKIIAQLDESVFYSEGGYEGYLTLDQDSITTETGETKKYTYTTTETKEYTGLPKNDPSLVEKTITKNGVTLTLSDISWVSMGSTVSGDSIVTNYKAVATYSGTATGTAAKNYTVTAKYKGTVTKEVEGDYIYSIVYMPAAEKTEETTEEKKSGWSLFGGSTKDTSTSEAASASESSESTSTSSSTQETTTSSTESTSTESGGDTSASSKRNLALGAFIVLLGLIAAAIIYFCNNGKKKAEANAEKPADETDEAEAAEEDGENAEAEADEPSDEDAEPPFIEEKEDDEAAQVDNTLFMPSEAKESEPEPDIAIDDGVKIEVSEPIQMMDSEMSIENNESKED